jgi:hypothetical protein
MYYSAKSVKDELDKHKHIFSIEVNGGTQATFGCPRETGHLYSKCSKEPNICDKRKKQTCYQILYLNSKDANGNIFLLTCLVFKFAIPSISTKSKYDGYIRENMLKGVLDIINIKNLVVVKI